MESGCLISFVIPHKGRFDMLKQTLISISKQNYPTDKIEIIVVSQTPDINNIPLIDNSSISLKRILRVESETISELRNHGVKQAAGQYIAFLDADIFISSNWITAMLSNLHDTERRIIVSAMQICNQSAPPLEHIRTCLSNIDLDVNVDFLPGRNLFMMRQSFEQIGGFPEHLITCEDYYFTDKAAQIGHLYYTSDATYIHLGEDKSFSEMFKKEIWRGQSNLQSIKGRHIPLREIPSFILPLWISLSILAALACLATQSYSLALLFFVLGAIPLFVYSVRLYRLSKHEVDFFPVLKFYAFYFPARAIGTLAGIFKAIGADHK